MNRFMMTAVLEITSSSYNIVTTPGSAAVKSSDINFANHTGKMVRGLDGSSKAAYGILTDDVSDGWYSVESSPGLGDETFAEIEDGFSAPGLVSLAIVISKRPYVELSGDIVKSQIRTPFEGGYVQSRPRFTRSREKWNAEYRCTSAEYSTITTFFKDNAGGMFFVSHPISHVVLIGRFSDDTIKYDPLSSSLTAVSIPFEEV